MSLTFFFLITVAEPIPTVIKDTVAVEEGEELQVAQFNFPNPTPKALEHQITFVARHGFYIQLDTQTLKACQPTSAALIAVLSDVYNNDTEMELCNGYSEKPIRFESFFHVLTLKYQVFNGSVSSVLARVQAIPGRHVWLICFII